MTGSSVTISAVVTPLFIFSPLPFVNVTALSMASEAGGGWPAALAAAAAALARARCLAATVSVVCVIPCGPEGLMQVMTAQNPRRNGSDKNAYKIGLTQELLYARMADTIWKNRKC